MKIFGSDSLQASMLKRVSCFFLAVLLSLGLLSTSAKATSLKLEESGTYDDLVSFLVTFVFGYGKERDYDSKNASTSKLLNSMLKEGACFVSAWYPYKTGTTQWESPDPLGKWNSYSSVSVQQVDWVLKNIFNCSDTDITAIKANLPVGGTYDPYIYNGHYYWYIGGIGSTLDGHIESYTQDGNFYRVVWSLRDFISGEIYGYYHAVVEAKTIDGKEYWSLHSNKQAPSAEQPASTFWFSDVPSGKWFYTPVKWAMGMGHILALILPAMSQKC